jgi:multimeric flavodoxin WrbA
MNKNNTALLLEVFLEGMKIAGASVELYYSELFTLSLF